jgi:hypothetical protein
LSFEIFDGFVVKKRAGFQSKIYSAMQKNVDFQKLELRNGN